jgi:hypothetical protein
MNKVSTSTIGRMLSAAKPISTTTEAASTLPAAACPKMRIRLFVMTMVSSVTNTPPAEENSSRRKDFSNTIRTSRSSSAAFRTKKPAERGLRRRPSATLDETHGRTRKTA